ncbi:G-protein coupled receptor moody [Periplaneta americana]|uniref:G-protein coupled receptor moody n=1 Tax=Periplaneta americana TaxID=6978 RepID=UPI0037E9B800
MFCCFNLPLAASTFWQRAWRHGNLLCELFPLTRYGLVAVSLFTVLAITINRYVMIGHPRLYPKLYRKQYLGLMVACTWVFGFGALIATWFGKWGRFGLDKRIGSCSILPDSHDRSPKEFLFIVAFVIPCLAIVVCYARIFYIVRKTALKSRLTTRNNTVTTTTQSCASGPGSVVSSEGKKLRADGSSGYEGMSVSGKFMKRCKFSPEDSALGSTSTGPTITTDKGSSFIENGHTSPPCNNNKSSSDVRIQIVDNVMSGGCRPDSIHLAPSPHLLSPPSPNHLRLPIQKKIFGEPSSSSGIETGVTGNDDEDEEGICSSRSATPTSLCSSSIMDPCGITTSSSAPNSSFPSSQRSRSLNRKRRRRERGASAVGVNSALSHVANVFRRGSQMKCASPRRHSTFTTSSAMATPGKMTAKDKKLLKMILVIFASFVICYLPITVSKTFRDTIDIHGLNIAGYILIYLTTCINPIIYVVMSSEYRQAYKNLLMCRGYTPDAAAAYPQQHQQPGNGVGGAGRSVSQRA